MGEGSMRAWRRMILYSERLPFCIIKGATHGYDYDGARHSEALGDGDRDEEYLSILMR